MKQRKKIIMLPSENGVIWKNKVGRLTTFKPDFFVEEWSRYNLYILSDEEIKNGDWYVQLEWNTIKQYQGEKISKAWNKKIIATTDTELIKQGIASINRNIIEAYVKDPFDEVEVEYNIKTIVVDNLADLICPLSTSEYEQSSHTITGNPKLNPDGTLAVSLVEEKMYSREEVEKLIHKFNMEQAGYPWALDDTIKWIKENL